MPPCLAICVLFEDHSVISSDVLTEIFIQTCMQAKVNGIISNSLLWYQGMARLQIDGILERVLKCQKKKKQQKADSSVINLS